MNQPRHCDVDGKTCRRLATFTIRATGYPMPMAHVCTEHVGPFLADDVSHGGSTHSWIVEHLVAAESRQ